MPKLSQSDETYDAEVIASRPRSVAHLIRESAAKHGPRDAFLHFVGDELVHVSWSEFVRVVDEWAAGLISLGVEAGDRVAIISSTRYEWVLADSAIMCAGAATTTVYPTSTTEDVGFLIADSGSRVIFADDASQLAKLRDVRDHLSDVSHVILFDTADASDLDDDWVVTLDDLLTRGKSLLEHEPAAVDARVDALTPGDLATIIYTSGTTGRPKGAELTHDSFVYKGAAVASLGFITEDDLHFLWLPLSHVFGKVLLSIAMRTGCPTAVDGRQDKIVDNLALVQPTWMGAAPRIFEKAKARVSLLFQEESGLKAKLIDWAIGVGAQVADIKEAGDAVPALLAARHAVADKLVLRKVRARFGGRVRFFISGSAPLDPDVARWFASVGLLIIEGYGLTETTAATTVNRPFEGSYQFGSIGWPLPQTQVKTDSDGELLVKGPGVMVGYHGNPEATAGVMTEDGWFRTGDVAEIDERGFVRITDRKKDVFKTSGGKYVAPGHIEAMFKGLCPYAAQFVVIGESRNYASALVTLDAEAIAAWAKGHGLDGASYAEIVTSEAAREMVQGYVDQLNSQLNRWETIKRFEILPRDLSIDEGELTPSMKLRRRVVQEHFAGAISGLYRS